MYRAATSINKHGRCVEQYLVLLTDVAPVEVILTILRKATAPQYSILAAAIRGNQDFMPLSNHCR